MKAKSVRKHLKQASEEIDRARQTAPGPDVDQQLAGIAEILKVGEEPPMTPEATIYPERGALDTIQRRLTVIVEQADDDVLVEHLERAKREILLVIMTLDDQWNKQREQ